MRKLLLTLILSLMMYLPAVARMYIPFKSVAPIQRINDDGVNTNYCTAFSINKDKGYWLTANHCWAETNTFAGKPIVWEAYNETLDLAIFSGPHADSLKFAIKAPDVGDELLIMGYPHGALDPIVFFGKLASQLARMTPTMSGAVFNVVGLPGDSGAPIIDKSGRVIGVCQLSNQAGVMWGVSWKSMKDSAPLMEYWEN